MEQQSIEIKAVHDAACALRTVCQMLCTFHQELLISLQQAPNGNFSVEAAKKYGNILQELQSKTEIALGLLLGQLDRPSEITPELKKWVGRQFTDEEIASGMQNIRETGGLPLADIIQDLEQAICNE